MQKGIETIVPISEKSFCNTCKHWCCKLLRFDHPSFTSRTSWGHKCPGDHNIFLQFSLHGPILYLAAFMMIWIIICMIPDATMMAWGFGADECNLREFAQNSSTNINDSFLPQAQLFWELPTTLHVRDPLDQRSLPAAHAFCRTPITGVHSGDLNCHKH